MIFVGACLSTVAALVGVTCFMLTRRKLRKSLGTAGPVEVADVVARRNWLWTLGACLTVAISLVVELLNPRYATYVFDFQLRFPGVPVSTFWAYAAVIGGSILGLTAGSLAGLRGFSELRLIGPVRVWGVKRGGGK